jgi:hypothetical protein
VCKAIDLEFNQIIALKVQIILSCLLFELGIFRCKKKKCLHGHAWFLDGEEGICQHWLASYRNQKILLFSA